MPTLTALKPHGTGWLVQTLLTDSDSDVRELFAREIHKGEIIETEHSMAVLRL
jgi:hypothetical protein